MFEDTFRQMLIATNTTGNLVYLVRAPQAKDSAQPKSPYMIFFPVAPYPRHVQTGPLTLYERDYQVSLFDSRQSRVLSMGDYLRSRIDGFRGDYHDVRFGAIFFRTQTIRWEAETELYHVVQEYRILYRFLQSNRSTNAVPQE